MEAIEFYAAGSDKLQLDLPITEQGRASLVRHLTPSLNVTTGCLINDIWRLPISHERKLLDFTRCDYLCWVFSVHSRQPHRFDWRDTIVVHHRTVLHRSR
jgi:hypothetical protein